MSLDELVHRTKFSKKEIQTIYQGFKQECPSGFVNEETFKHIYGQFFPFADTSIYAHLIFSTFDARSPGLVTFEDFLICLSTLCRGSLEERLKWIFTLYDTKRSGKLTRDVIRLKNKNKIEENSISFFFRIFNRLLLLFIHFWEMFRVLHTIKTSSVHMQN